MSENTGQEMREVADSLLQLSQKIGEAALKIKESQKGPLINIVSQELRRAEMARDVLYLTPNMTVSAGLPEVTEGRQDDARFLVWPVTDQDIEQAMDAKARHGTRVFIELPVVKEMMAGARLEEREQLRKGGNDA